MRVVVVMRNSLYSQLFYSAYLTFIGYSREGKVTDLFFVGSVNKQVGTIALLGDLRRTPSLHNGGRGV